MIKILLIGAGWFGKNHLRVLLDLEKKGKISLIGVVEKNRELRKEISEKYHIPVFDKIDANTLKHIDGVDIVTPINTHFALAKRCLRYTNVFIEKPLAGNTDQAGELDRFARKQKRILMVGHIFRFHPITKKLKIMFSRKREHPYRAKGQFFSPIVTWTGKRAALDNLHLFDILDYLLEETPVSVRGEAKGGLTTVFLRYPNGLNAIFELGWLGEEKERNLDFYFKNEIVHCDFKRNFIKIMRGKKCKKIFFTLKITPLEAELETFIKLLNKKDIPYVNGEIGVRIVKIADQADKKA